MLNKKTKVMNTLKSELSINMFADYILSNEEMFNVRGGQDPIVMPSPPPVRI